MSSLEDLDHKSLKHVVCQVINHLIVLCLKCVVFLLLGFICHSERTKAALKWEAGGPGSFVWMCACDGWGGTCIYCRCLKHLLGGICKWRLWERERASMGKHFSQFLCDITGFLTHTWWLMLITISLLLTNSITHASSFRLSFTYTHTSHYKTDSKVTTAWWINASKGRRKDQECRIEEMRWKG